MSSVSRRIVVYWLLLLVPTLLVGASAIVLLRREQTRIAEQGGLARDAREAAVAARARLTVETVELLVSEVQSGLLDTLAAEPDTGIDLFLERWERNNPLVQTAFRATAEGRLIRPTLQAADEGARAFVRRFGSRFLEQAPWSENVVTPSFKEEDMKKSAADAPAAARQEVDSNVSQVQSVRRDVQELLKRRDYATSELEAPPPVLADASDRRERAQTRSTETEANQSDGYGRAAPASGMSGGVPPAARESPQGAVSARPSGSIGKQEARVDHRSGWKPVVVDGRLHLLGWLQRSRAGEVRGVELELGTLIGRLGGVLPAELSVEEGYVLRDEQGRVLHQAGLVPRMGAPTVRVPIAATLLPGWEIAGYLAIDDRGSGSSAGFLWMGTLLVGIFLVSILAGGSLLLRQARRSEEDAAQKTSFVANVSHEFKTPLTTIRLYSELLEQGRVRDPEQGGKYLRTIARETQRLARLVNNALDFSRLEQGQKRFARETVNLTSDLGRLLDTHAPRVAEAGLTLKRELPDESLSVMTDRDALEQIVLNLIDNACKYGAAGGEVVVAAEAGRGGGAVVRVSDRGPGVPPEHARKIFDKFHRVNDALTAEKSGAGLGLSIVRQLARGMGGDVRYQPRPGGGAEFVVEIP